MGHGARGSVLRLDSKIKKGKSDTLYLIQRRNFCSTADLYLGVYGELLKLSGFQAEMQINSERERSTDFSKGKGIVTFPGVWRPTKEKLYINIYFNYMYKKNSAVKKKSKHFN